MSWEVAIRYALYWSGVNKRRYVVRGYRGALGGWWYAAYPMARTWE